jgi:hypothetical protein
MAAAGFGLCQEAKELAAGGVEGSLLGFGLAMGEQRPAVVADEIANNLLNRPAPEVAVHLQSADDLAAQSPEVVAVYETRSHPFQRMAGPRHMDTAAMGATQTCADRSRSRRLPNDGHHGWPVGENDRAWRHARVRRA